MNRTTKILLSGCSIVVIAGVLVAVVAVRYVTTHKDAWLEKGKAARTEGLDAGKAKNESECLDATMVRFKADRSIVGGVQARLWLSGCLESSQPISDFCGGVPRDHEITATVAWRIATCARYGLESNSNCSNTLQEVQEYCYGPKREAKGRVGPP